MSIFPFINQTKSTPTVHELPLFKEYAYDFENNSLLYKTGKTYVVEGNEALKIWILNALTTQRYRYGAYSINFGNEVETLIGKAIDDTIIYAEIKRFTIEALMVNPYIEELNHFKFTKEKYSLIVEFDCKTVYGILNLSKLWEGG